MKTYEITIPIAGHPFMTVKAENEAEAEQKAFDAVQRNDIEEWEPLECFHKGNVCYCPSPWELTIECVSEDDETEST